MAETISYIKAGNQNHPIDAVTVNGLTLTSEEKSAWSNKQDALTFDSKPTKNSTNPVTSGGVYTAISTFVSSAYLSTNYYNKTEVSQEIANALTGAFVVVSGTELPTPTHDTLGKIYLLSADDDNPSGQGPEDLKLEYITIWDQILYGYRWEQIGTTRIDLTDYVTTSALSTTLSSYATTSAMTSALSGKQNTITDLASIRSGASKGATAYQKPSTGIPASDIAAGVIPSLAGYATEAYVDQEVSTAVSVKQDKLVSGTNIKTINSESLLGSGDLVITQEQADWNQNDNTSDDYVKNRTHYVETLTFENVSFNLKSGGVFNEEQIIYGCSGTLGGNSVTISSWHQTQDYYYNNLPVEFEYSIIVKKSGTSMIVNGVEVPNVFDSQGAVINSSVNVGDIPVEVAVHKLDGKYLDLKTINGQSVKGSGNLVTKSVYVGTCSTAAATADKIVTVQEFPLNNSGAPVMGTTIVVKFTNTNSAANAKLVVNGTSAASIWFNAAAYTSAGNVAGAAGRYSTYTWDGTYWVWVSHGTDNNDNTLAYQVRYNSASMTATDAFVRYRLLFTSVDNNHWVPGTKGTSTNATSARNVNTTPINPLGQIVFYNATTAIAAAGTPGATTLYTQMNVTLGYTFNTTGTVALTTKVPVYVKCAPQATGGAVIDPDTPCVQTLPSTEDGKLYIYLGIASSATAVEITPYHPVFYYKDGQIRLWTNAAESGGSLIIDAVIEEGETEITIPSGTFDAIDSLDSGKVACIRLTDENDDLGGPQMYYFVGSIPGFLYSFSSPASGSETDILTVDYSNNCKKISQDTRDLVDITWAELVNKRNESKLNPGTWYRITDYATTTTQTDTQSAGNSFDVIVLATSSNTLNENARAIWNTDVQDYFKQAGAKLDAWELKYCLDNDAARFSWAKEMTISMGNTTYTRDRTQDTSHNLTDYYAWSGNASALLYTTSEVPEAGDHTYDDTFAEDADITAVSADGKGVIYYMKDEWGNECPYDFKNIQFKRSAQWFSQHSTWATNILGSTPSNDMYFYTFSWYNANMEIEDASVIGYKLEGDEEGAYCGVYDNKIGALNAYNNGEYGQQTKFSLNSIVFISSANYDSFYGCYSNTFGDNCQNNTFGNSCQNNTFGNSCSSNTFGNSYYSNTFGNGCGSNTFGNSCQYNTFGNSYYNNTLGDSCQNNAFGNSCGSNIFGYDCQNNTFGNSCDSNTFGNYCKNNTFGNNCQNNTFGIYCQYNTFGNDCDKIKFGKSSTIRNYYQNIIVDNGNKYIYLYCSQTTTSSNVYRNVHIYSGVNNTTTWKTITDSNVKQTFLTEYKPANSLVISV